VSNQIYIETFNRIVRGYKKFDELVVDVKKEIAVV
jgi:hypothetical protein